jgi:hypothetical protein
MSKRHDANTTVSNSAWVVHPSPIAPSRSRSSTPPAIPASRNAAGLGYCNACSVQVRCLVVDDHQQFLDAARVLLELEGVPSASAIKALMGSTAD